MITAFATAVLTLASPAADTPIEPITSDTIAISLTLPEWDAMCSSYATLDGAVMNLAILGGDPSLYSQLMEAIDAWEVGMIEDGLGASSRMTMEAETMFLNALHGCA